MIMIFSRSSYIKSWSRSQGFTYDSSYDYKLHKKYPYFDAVTRGQKPYAFNVMKGEIDYKNKSADDAAEKASVKAFDFCFTEIKTIQHNKRISRIDRTQEFSALVFDAFGYTFKPMIITPREMQIENDFSDLPVQQADPDVEDLLKAPEEKLAEKKAKADKKAQEAAAAANASNASNATDAAAEEAPAVVAAEEDPAAAAMKAEEAAQNATANETEKVDFNKTNPLSHKFNETFKIEAIDHVQADGVLSAALKQALLDHPQFFVDFQEDQFMVYREYTMEPEEYTEALQLGAIVLGHLPTALPINETATEDPKAAEKALDLTVFVSHSEL